MNPMMNCGRVPKAAQCGWRAKVGQRCSEMAVVADPVWGRWLCQAHSEVMASKLWMAFDSRQLEQSIKDQPSAR